jgi:hypothetical protein
LESTLGVIHRCSHTRHREIFQFFLELIFSVWEI